MYEQLDKHHEAQKKRKDVFDFMVAAVRGLSIEIDKGKPEIEVSVKRPKMIWAIVGNKPTWKVCVDTGSGVNLVSKEYLDRNRIKVLRAPYKGPPIAVLDQRQLKVTQTALVPIELGAFRTPVKAIIVESMPFDLLLGNPFLDEHVSTIDFRTQTMYVGGLLCPSVSPSHQFP